MPKTSRKKEMEVQFITEISVENFRCFRSEQRVQIAPLTFLVGENSSGKTSFLAITRVLWNMALRQRRPIFNESPFDLGGFDEIVHKHHLQESAPIFRAGFGLSTAVLRSQHNSLTTINFCDPSKVWHFRSSFEKNGQVPTLSKLSVAQGCREVEERFDGNNLSELVLSESGGEQSFKTATKTQNNIFGQVDFLPLPDFSLMYFQRAYAESVGKNKKDMFKKFIEFVDSSPFSRMNSIRLEDGVYATSPVRSKPERTYHATNFTPDPEGNYVPFYLANIHSQSPENWKSTLDQIEEFGKKIGLFSSLSIKRSRELDGAPFQIHVGVTKADKTHGSNRSLVDIGYGVSQTLPILVSLLNQESAPLTLMQQPEIHLHPKAQAAIGDLFCNFVQHEKRQLLVETHSDYLIERVRILVKEGALDPAFVTVLFFERKGSDVYIHSINFDELGNVNNAPKSYRSFFLDEMDRSLGL